MKSFFEFLGFASTALISGFLVFTYVGHKKNAEKTGLRDALVSEYNTDESEEADAASLPELKPVSSGRIAKEKKKTAAKGESAEVPATKKPSLAVESAAATEKLKSLYGDNDFVMAAVKKWKKTVEDAAETHSVKPHLLLGSVIVKSYIGNYTMREFNRDVAEHAGDQAKPAASALKSYDYAWSVGKVVQQYGLAKYFSAPAPVAVAKTPALSPSKKPAASAAPQKAKPAALVSPAEASFREMVAKESGFSSWQGLQRLGEPEQKKNAERRVKTLMSAVRVK